MIPLDPNLMQEVITALLSSGGEFGIMDTTLRDGHQSLLATRFRTDLGWTPQHLGHAFRHGCGPDPASFT